VTVHCNLIETGDLKMEKVILELLQRHKDCIRFKLYKAKEFDLTYQDSYKNDLVDIVIMGGVLGVSFESEDLAPQTHYINDQNIYTCNRDVFKQIIKAVRHFNGY
jgi:hypothetical protein